LRIAGNAESAGIVDLHRDVQTCGYHDVQVMWGMLGLETAGAPTAPERRRKRAPSFWHLLLSRRARAAAGAVSCARAGVAPFGFGT